MLHVLDVENVTLPVFVPQVFWPRCLSSISGGEFLVLPPPAHSSTARPPALRRRVFLKSREYRTCGGASLQAREGWKATQRIRGRGEESLSINLLEHVQTAVHGHGPTHPMVETL